MKVRTIAAALLLAPFMASSLAAQTAQTTLLRAVMSSAGGDSGVTDVLVHTVKDTAGNILSGSVDINLAYQFPNDEAVTGLGIANSGGGSVLLLATKITTASPVMATAGSGRISGQVQVTAGNQTSLAVLGLMLASPSQYSVTAVTVDYPVVAMSGVLQPAASAVLMAAVSSSAGSGAATIIVSYTGAPYAMTSAEVALQLAYQFPAQVTFSGLRVYTGQGESGQIAVAADLLPGTTSSSSGAGVLTPPPTEIDMTNAQLVNAVQNMLLSPSSFSVDVNTVENPTAALTGLLRTTDSMTFPIGGFAGSGAASQIVLHTLRQPSGSVQAGTAIFDVNYRLTPGAKISGIDIDGDVSVSPVSADPSGWGNVYEAVTVVTSAGLTSLNGVVANPAAHKVDLITNTTLSAPLAATTAALPVIAAVIPIVEVTDLTAFAPGELIEIYGTNLSPVTTDLSGWPGSSLPSPLNGVSANLGGHGTRILYVSPGQVDVLLPFGTPLGSQPLTLTNAIGTSAPVSLNVLPVAPALYNFAFENVGFSLVSQSNPAAAGDTLVLYATGLGQTTPILLTGQIVPNGPPFYDTVAVKATIGGANAGVIYSIAAPPYVAGLYQMAVTVPSGLPAGNQQLIVTAGGVQSNPITIVVK